MADLLATLLVAVCTGSLVLTLWTHVAAHRAVRRRRARDGDRPPISVLKPLKGVDDGLYENLCALARQDYPSYEILLGASDPDDPALEVARQVAREHPRIPMTVMVCARPVGMNPKVNNLTALAARAAHQHLLVSDSNVRPDPGYLSALVAETGDARVGLVTSVLAGDGERSLGALFENLHLASFVAPAVCAGDAAGHPCVVGKSMLFRKNDLGAVGGWWSVRDILAEDYILGRTFHRAGFRVALSGRPLVTWNERWPLSRFLNRHVRWGQIRRRINPAAYAAEPLLNPVPWLSALLAVASTGAGAWGLDAPALAVAAAVGVALKCASDDLVARRLRGRGFGVAALAWIPVKDLLIAGAWAVAAFRRTVDWRGNTLRIGPDSRLQAPPDPWAGDAGEPAAG